MHYGPDIAAIEREKEDGTHLCITSDMLPAIKEWMTGKEYEVTLKVKQMESEVVDNDTVKAEFKVLSAQSN